MPMTLYKREIMDREEAKQAILKSLERFNVCGEPVASDGQFFVVVSNLPGLMRIDCWKIQPQDEELVAHNVDGTTDLIPWETVEEIELKY